MHTRLGLSSFWIAVFAILAAPSIVLAECRSGRLCTCPSCPGGEKSLRRGGWFVVETENFQICCDESEAPARHLARHAETLRTEFRSRWLGDKSSAPWTPKCEIVLHSSQKSYVGAVGPGSERTAGSSLVNVREDRVTSRRIDLLGGRTEFLSAALPHELTHIVLKERFTSTAMPRWADEGIAILADGEAKQGRHAKDLRDALTYRSTFSLPALLTMDEYPRSDRWGAYYGQSASVAKFLIDRKNAETFMGFVERATASGYDAALRECYGISGVAELDRQWRRQLLSVQSSQNQGGSTTGSDAMPASLVLR